jgi:hypothetical protein
MKKDQLRDVVKGLPEVVAVFRVHDGVKDLEGREYTADDRFVGEFQKDTGEIVFFSVKRFSREVRFHVRDVEFDCYRLLHKWESGGWEIEHYNRVLSEMHTIKVRQ